LIIPVVLHMWSIAPPHFDKDFGRWCWVLAERLSPAAQCPAGDKQRYLVEGPISKNPRQSFG